MEAHELQAGPRGRAEPRRLALAAAMLASTVALGSCASSQGAGQGAAFDRRADVSVARQLMMEGLENEMNFIEFALSGARRTRPNLPDLKRRAYQINVNLLAFPHLFPPDTKPVIAADRTRTPAGSIASPAVWSDNDTFYRMAQASAAPAYDASQAKTIEAYRDSIKKVRGACDGCHARFMDESALKAGYKPPSR